MSTQQNNYPNVYYPNITIIMIINIIILYTLNLKDDPTLYWRKNRHMEQQNQIEHPDIYPHTYEYMILTKEQKSYLKKHLQ